jgi:hypothetical protein
VYLLPFVGVMMRPGASGWELRQNEDIDPRDAEQVVFEFRLPNTVADPYAHGGGEYRPPDHPEYDPERDTPDPYFPDRKPPDTWAVPADVANRYCVGLKFWSGRRPLTDEQVRAIDARRERPKRSLKKRSEK